MNSFISIDQELRAMAERIENYNVVMHITADTQKAQKSLDKLIKQSEEIQSQLKISTNAKSAEKEIKKIFQDTEKEKVEVDIDPKKAEETLKRVKGFFDEASKSFKMDSAVDNLTEKLKTGGIMDIGQSIVEVGKLLGDMTPWSMAASAVSLLASAYINWHNEMTAATRAMEEHAESIREIDRAAKELRDNNMSSFFQKTMNAENATATLEELISLIESGASDNRIEDALYRLEAVLPGIRDHVMKVGEAWTIQEEAAYGALEASRENLDFEMRQNNIEALEKQLDQRINGEYGEEYIQGLIAERQRLIDIHNEGMANEYTYQDSVRKENAAAIGNLTKIIMDYYGGNKELQGLIDREKFLLQEDKKSEENQTLRSKMPNFLGDMDSIRKRYGLDLAELDQIYSYTRMGDLTAAGNLAGQIFDDWNEAQAWVDDTRDNLVIDYANAMTNLGLDILHNQGKDLTDIEYAAIEKMIDEMRKVLSEQPEAMAALLDMLRNASIPIELMVSVKGGHQKETTIEVGERSIQRMAEGTNYYPGGLTQINERGDEMVELPEGSRIYPAQRSREYVEVSRGNGNYTVNVYGMTVREEADVDRVASALYRKLQLAAMNR